MKLYIGTANFLIKYGFKKKIVKKNNVLKIKNYLKKKKLLNFDTSFAYDDFIYSKNFFKQDILKISTKIVFKNSDFKKKNFEKKIIDLLKKKIIQSKIKNFETILIHNYEDIKIKNFPFLFHLMKNLKKLGLAKKIGISVYNPKSIVNLDKKYKIDVVQAPLNLLDRRFMSAEITKLFKKKQIKLQARSIFLQGFLLENEKIIKKKIKTNKIFSRLFNWCKKNKISRHEACINFIKSQNSLDSVVIGIENLDQLKGFLAIFFSKKKKVFPRNIFTNDINIIDPRRW